MHVLLQGVVRDGWACLGADSSDGVKLYLYPSSACPTVYHYGPAWLDASISVDVKGAVQVKGNFVASGAWSRKP